MNVARASLDELLLDYEDFLRQRRLSQWAKESPEARAVRAVGRQHSSDRADPPDEELYRPWLASPDPGVVANAVLCLIHQANYLLDRQIAGLERGFIEGGGYSERLAAARIAERQKTKAEAPQCPACPLCGKPLVLRTTRVGSRAGSQFWGCSAYPGCKGSRPLDGGARSVGSDRSDGEDQ